MPVFTKGDKAVLYVHVPKAGGSAIEKHFEAAGYAMSFRDGKTGPGTLNHYRRCSPQHMHAAPCEETFRLERFDAIFTVVREPLARFRSEYSMRRRRNLDLDPAVVEQWSRRILRKFEQDPYVLDNHIRPQSEFVLPGALVHRLEDGLESLMALLNDQFSLGIPEEVARVRTSEKNSGVPSQDVELTPALESRLRDFYRTDFDTFGY
ncbi:sulfotransferase family 2 domain-containing protein [Isoptericola aurantiacus]|uniref:sulfotransferase family 2 domain-containing protein n=1 Tax=Isoptericola aurantiacus TaxID=3377839 RepID=UPI00383B054B